jgi:glycine cleavage system aminomethyltransferase T
MGYVQTAQAQLDNTIYVQVRDKQLKAQVVKFPFV